MAIVPNPYKTTGALGWIDDRFPLTKMWRDHLSAYYAPKNFNFWYFFGSLALLVLVNQLLTGIFLTMNYKPGADLAFDSVEYIMRDVAWGNIIRYMHSTGASAFFIVVYLHMFRGLIYGSHRKPRELIWIFGSLIFLVLMAEAFCGYVLPWGNMSYWGASVIINLFGTVPFIGPDLVTWIQGDFVPGDATLNRLFSLHVIALPFVLVGLVFAHILALHEVGSNNPDGIEIKKNKDPETGIPKDGIPFHPYYTVKDLVGVAGFLILFSAVIFYMPDGSRRVVRAGDGLPDPVLRSHLLYAGWRRLLPRAAELHAGESGQHARAHHASLVFRHLLRDVARDAVLRRHPNLGRHRHVWCGCDFVLPAVAGSVAGQVNPLQRADFQDCSRHLCGDVPVA